MIISQTSYISMLTYSFVIIFMKYRADYSMDFMKWMKPMRKIEEICGMTRGMSEASSL